MEDLHARSYSSINIRPSQTYSHVQILPDFLHSCAIPVVCKSNLSHQRRVRVSVSSVFPFILGAQEFSGATILMRAMLLR